MILHSLQLPIPEFMEGQLPTDLYRDAILSQIDEAVQIELQTAAHELALDDPGIDDDIELDDAFMQRMKGLGYIE